ncbi:glyoxalase [Pseudofrankia sp. BMG5.36]|uniref:glyoxalase n=1 Tax=Pseudofrankia sp. BMG5.36 TaxID=1834512 RepID=UPI0008D9F5D8|nr:glyoxalase [Pseudofrankia sp. BMG5.36]OHV62137.1 glyoxalase [Pseudofrankia sp. BMG5.36]
MPRFHHANLGVPPGLDDAEGAFLVDVLGYRKMDVPPDLAGIARWYEADDGSQIHLSIDPDHRPAARAHTAIEVDEDVERRLDAAGIAYRSGGRGDLAVVFCADPAGNHWELRRHSQTP